MCGILGAVLRRGRMCERRLRRATRSLQHRGPDGEGYWISPDQRVGLGHRRLSIIGVQNGHQPIANEDQTIQIAVNGEFYDYERMRRELESRGHRFRTDSDSELALHAYEEMGVECLSQLRGEFALLLWDGLRRRLFAARDRFGVKPLVYADQPDGLWLASEAKALFAAGILPAWDEEAFFHVAHMQYLLPDRTLFSGIRQLRPGHYMTVDEHRVDIRRYWDMDFPQRGSAAEPGAGGTPGGDELELVEACRGQLVESVRLRLRSDVPLCCHLSGGIDSSTVLGIASHCRRRPVDAFVVSFDVDGYDELIQARQMAAHVDANLHVVRVTCQDLLDSLEPAVRASEGLAVNGHLAAKFLLHRAIRERGFHVAITGEGADEVFAGYSHQRIDLWRSQGASHRERQLLASNRTSLGMMLAYGPSLSLASVQRKLGFVPAWLEAKACLAHRLQSIMREDALAAFSGRDAYVELLEQPGVMSQLAGRHPVDQSSWLWSRTALANYILKTLGDGTEMAFSVEGRVPFLDHVLVEFLRQAPLGMKIRDGTEKYLLRQAARPFVTPQVVDREKHPFDAPPVSITATAQNRDWLRQRVDSPAGQDQPFFSPRKLRELLECLPNLGRTKRLAWDPVLMIVLSTVLIHQWLAEMGSES